MAVGWKLLVQRGKRIERFVAQAADEAGAIEAVRRRRGMSKAIILASEASSDDDLTSLGLRDGEAQRTATPRD